MNLRLLTVASALTLGALATVSAPALAQGFFVEGRVGQSDLKDVPGSRKDTGFTLGGGYWFNQNFAVEGGWTDLHSRNYPGGKVELDAFYAGVKGRALFDRGNGTGFFLGGRGGLLRWDGRITANEPGYSPYKDTGTDWYAGVFTGYQITPNIGVSLNFDRFRADDLDTDLVSAGFEYRF